ncbi:MAG: hypothetical protein ACFCU5_11470 [Pleurocapsa sp.]
MLSIRQLTSEDLALMEAMMQVIYLLRRLETLLVAIVRSQLIYDFFLNLNSKI